jgi:tetratricopeptide (TPR) repeat protein
VISRFSGKGEQFRVCESYRVLGNVYFFKGETEKAIDHLKTALEIASPFNWDDPLFWAHYSLVKVFLNEDRFGDAHAHIEHAKSHAVNDAYNLGRAVELQAQFWFMQRMFKEARSAASHAADVFERLGAMEDIKRCRSLFQNIERAER